jgi:hypothetical protein
MSPVGYGELVQVLSLTSSGFPADFTWRGRRHVVRLVESCRGTERGRGAERPGRRVYQLRTISGMRCLLSMDPRNGLWRMEQVLPGGGG